MRKTAYVFAWYLFEVNVFGCNKFQAKTVSLVQTFPSIDSWWVWKSSCVIYTDLSVDYRRCVHFIIDKIAPIGKGLQKCHQKLCILKLVWITRYHYHSYLTFYLVNQSPRSSGHQGCEQMMVLWVVRCHLCTHVAYICCSCLCIVLMLMASHPYIALISALATCLLLWLKTIHLEPPEVGRFPCCFWNLLFQKHRWKSYELKEILCKSKEIHIKYCSH